MSGFRAIEGIRLLRARLMRSGTCGVAHAWRFAMHDRITHVTTAAAQSGWKTLSIHPQRYRAARELCRKRSPDLFFASYFISRPRRYALFALDALPPDEEIAFETDRAVLAALRAHPVVFEPAPEA